MEDEKAERGTEEYTHAHTERRIESRVPNPNPESELLPPLPLFFSFSFSFFPSLCRVLLLFHTFKT